MNKPKTIEECLLQYDLGNTGWTGDEVRRRIGRSVADFLQGYNHITSQQLSVGLGGLIRTGGLVIPKRGTRTQGQMHDASSASLLCTSFGNHYLEKPESFLSATFTEVVKKAIARREYGSLTPILVFPLVTKNGQLRPDAKMSVYYKDEARLITDLNEIMNPTHVTLRFNDDYRFAVK